MDQRDLSNLDRLTLKAERYGRDSPVTIPAWLAREIIEELQRGEREADAARMKRDRELRQIQEQAAAAHAKATMRCEDVPR